MSALQNVFHGKSKTARVEFGRDRVATRDESLAAARRQREERTRRNHEKVSATKVQKSWRGYATRLHLVRDCAAALADASVLSSSDVRWLRQYCALLRLGGIVCARDGSERLSTIGTALYEKIVSTFVRDVSQEARAAFIATHLAPSRTLTSATTDLLLRNGLRDADVIGFAHVLLDKAGDDAVLRAQKAVFVAVAEVFAAPSEAVSEGQGGAAAALRDLLSFCLVQPNGDLRSAIDPSFVTRVMALNAPHPILADRSNAVALLCGMRMRSTNVFYPKTLKALLALVADACQNIAAKDWRKVLNVAGLLIDGFAIESTSSPGMSETTAGLFVDCLTAVFSRINVELLANQVAEQLTKPCSTVEAAATAPSLAPLALLFRDLLPSQLHRVATLAGTTGAWSEHAAAARSLSALIRLPFRFARLPRTRLLYISLAPVLSAVAMGPGFLAHTTRFILDHTDIWTSKDGHAMMKVVDADTTTLYSEALQHVVDTSASDVLLGGKPPLQLTASLVTDVVKHFRDVVFRAHMHGCSNDGATPAFIASVSSLLVKLRALNQTAHFCSAQTWVVQEHAWPSRLTLEEWRFGGIGVTSGTQQGVAQTAADRSGFGSEDEDPEAPDAQTRIVGRVAVGAVPDNIVADKKMAFQVRMAHLLHTVPYVAPFATRALVFTSLLQSTTEQQGFRGFDSGEFRIRRGQVLDDSFRIMHNFTPEQMMGRINMMFLDHNGNEEAGFGDGVFKEFLLSLSKEAFTPKSGLFAEASDGGLYPHPRSDLVGPEHLKFFHFLGRILGKALFDGVLLNIPLSLFFRNLLLGRTNGFNDLPSLDKDLYRNLCQLKTLAVSGSPDLDSAIDGLTFSVATEHFGEVREVDLIPTGRTVPVTRGNVSQYIHLLSHFRLNREIHRQAAAFREGVADMVPGSWLSMFDGEELSILFQGDNNTDAPLDVEDWEGNASYGGTLNADHPQVRWFWNLVREMSAPEQRKLLKFVTSVDRAPLLGFRHLNPRFCLHGYHSADGPAALPSAGTCMSLLKMPMYPSADVLKEKLTFAIHNTETFELS